MTFDAFLYLFVWLQDTWGHSLRSAGLIASYREEQDQQTTDARRVENGAHGVMAKSRHQVLKSCQTQFTLRATTREGDASKKLEPIY